jgi:hypothetical protein
LVPDRQEIARLISQHQYNSQRVLLHCIEGADHFAFALPVCSFGGGRGGGYGSFERRPAYADRGRRSADDDEGLGNYSARFDDDSSDDVSSRRGAPAPGRKAYAEWRPVLSDGEGEGPAGADDGSQIVSGRRGSEYEESDTARTFVPRGAGGRGRRPAYEDEQEQEGGWGQEEDQVRRESRAVIAQIEWRT